MGLGLTEVPEVPSTITDANSLCFLMVYNTAPNGRRFMSYDCRKLDRFAESEFWANSTFRTKSEFWKKFTITSPETLNTKVATNELSFPLVTHIVYSDARFESYWILKSGWGARNFLDRPANDLVLRAEDAWNLARVVYKFRKTLTQLFDTYSYAHFQ
jgi:hypothetical protein